MGSDGRHFGKLMLQRALHAVTPLVKSAPLSAALGHEVFLKLDALQPAGSFKLRGIGARVQAARAQGAEHVVSSSGGNAGLATAYAARELGLSATVVLPTSTPASTADRLENMGATATFHGAHWNEANARAEEMVEEMAAQGQKAELVHPFEGDATWDGHASVVDEIAEQLDEHCVPACVVTVCGGGGLLVGIVRGIERQQAGGRWGGAEVPIVCVETEGADSLAQSVAAGELVTLPAITSVAKSLGAVRVAPEALRVAQESSVRTAVVSDQEAVGACLRFADDHRILVEPACGAGLAAVYGRADALLRCCEASGPERPVVVEVCGGALVDRAALEAWSGLVVSGTDGRAVGQ